MRLCGGEDSGEGAEGGRALVHPRRALGQRVVRVDLERFSELAQRLR
jgi:hypothetical protein